MQTLLMKAFQPDISQVESSLGEPVGFSTFSVNICSEKSFFFFLFSPKMLCLFAKSDNDRLAHLALVALAESILDGGMASPFGVGAVYGSKHNQDLGPIRFTVDVTLLVARRAILHYLRKRAPPRHRAFCGII